MDVKCVFSVIPCSFRHEDGYHEREAGRARLWSLCTSALHTTDNATQVIKYSMNGGPQRANDRPENSSVVWTAVLSLDGSSLVLSTDMTEFMATSPGIA